MVCARLRKYFFSSGDVSPASKNWCVSSHMRMWDYCSAQGGQPALHFDLVLVDEKVCVSKLTLFLLICYVNSTVFPNCSLLKYIAKIF